VPNLNLRETDGRAVLARLKEDASLKWFRPLLLIPSDSKADIVKSYEPEANCYVTKPVQVEECENLSNSINEFWLANVNPQQVQGG
jgi:two-component system, chemotaxis family, response regulator Rcp1